MMQSTVLLFLAGLEEEGNSKTKEKQGARLAGAPAATRGQRAPAAEAPEGTAAECRLSLRNAGLFRNCCGNPGPRHGQAQAKIGFWPSCQGEKSPPALPPRRR